MNLPDQLEKSSCFGIAYDPNAKECKMCDLQQECMRKSAENRDFDSMKVLKPETKEAMDQIQESQETARNPEPSNNKRKKKENDNSTEGIPDTKGLSIEELKAILQERGGTCKEYSNPQIQKMRLIMAIKETYK